MIRLLIADDHRIVREGLKQLLMPFGDIEVTAEANDGVELLARLREFAVDLVLLDMSMPGLCGDELVARIRAHYPGLPILILSMHKHPESVTRALKAGANGYLSKDNGPEILLAAIRRVAANGRFLDPLLAEQMVFETVGQVTVESRHECLTSREFHVMRQLAAGYSINDIAHQLSLSSKTVSTHKARLMEKMGFLSNAEMIRYAVVNGLAP